MTTIFFFEYVISYDDMNCNIRISLNINAPQNAVYLMIVSKYLKDCLYFQKKLLTKFYVNKPKYLELKHLIIMNRHRSSVVNTIYWRICVDMFEHPFSHLIKKQVKNRIKTSLLMILYSCNDVVYMEKTRYILWSISSWPHYKRTVFIKLKVDGDYAHSSGTNRIV